MPAEPRTQTPPESAPPPKAVRPADRKKEPAETSSAQHATTPTIEPLDKPNKRKLGDGKEHGFEPISLLEPEKIHSFTDLTTAMRETTAGARDLGEAVDVFREMVKDEKCYRVLTLSGNATPLTKTIASLIDRGIINCIVSTGSICTHSFSAERGRPMFKVPDPEATDDNWFYNRGYNRIFDVIELEESLNEGFNILKEITDDLEEDAVVTSSDVTRMLGEHLNEHFPKENGLLHAAARADVPIFIPSFSDCEIGLDFYAHNKIREKAGKPTVMFDAFGDWEKYAELIKEHKDSCGIVTLGGGAPRNWAQQAGPSFDILSEYGVEPKSLVMRFRYGIRVCTAPSWEGGLSGCTYSEGRSWGKFWPPEKEGVKAKKEETGMQAEVQGDYNLAFPLIVAAILEEAGE